MAEQAFVRDLAVMAVIFGAAAAMWFGWAMEAPPRRWRPWLIVGAGVGLLIAIIGGVLVWRHWGPESALASAETRRTFGIICGIEFGLAGLGGAVLGITKRQQWVSAWIAFVVGAHFIPLAFLFNDLGLIGLAVVVMIGAVAGVVKARRSEVTPSAVVGLVSGAGLVLFAGRSAVLALG